MEVAYICPPLTDRELSPQVEEMADIADRIKHKAAKSNKGDKRSAAKMKRAQAQSKLGSDAALKKKVQADAIAKVMKGKQ